MAACEWQRLKNIKAGVGSLSLVSLDKYSKITFHHIKIRVPLGCPSLILATVVVASSCLTVETSDMPFVVKLASGDLTS